MRIELHFRYTIDDVRDAVAPERRSKRALKSSPRWQVIKIWIVGIPVICTALYLAWSGKDALHTSELLPPVRDLLFLLGSSAAPALAVICAMLISLRRSARLLRR